MAAPVVKLNTFPHEAFSALIKRLSGINTIWEGEEVPFQGVKNGKPNSIIILDVLRVKPLGVDEIRYTWDPTAQGGDGANEVEVGGQRVYTINVRVESYSFNDPAYDPLEDLRLKFMWPVSHIQDLTDMGVAFYKTHDIIPLKVVRDNREIFAAACDMEFGFAPYQSVVDAGGGIIEKVNDGKPFVIHTDGDEIDGEDT